MDELIADLRCALRSMRRSPGFTAVALLMLALGTGANAAMFSMIDSIMLRSPFSDSDRLAIVLASPPGGQRSAAISLPQYQSLVESAPALESIAAIGGGDRPILQGLGELRRMNVECVTAGMFPMLGSSALIGRTFTPDEDRPGAPGVVILSYRFWQREMGGAADAVGRQLTLNGVPATIVGIMPPRFGGPFSRNNNDGWLPLGPALGGATPIGCNGRGSVNTFARLAPGLSFEAAARQATESAAIERIPDWQDKTGATLQLISLDAQNVSSIRTPMLALLGAVGLVLFIACANVANLQLERVLGRRREIAVRLAIGATRGRIVQQVLAENVLLSIMGGAAGLIAARLTLHLLVTLLPPSVPHLNEIEVGTRILAASIGVSLLAGIGVGFVPALQASSPRVSDDLRQSSPTTSAAGNWTRRILVVSQIALSLTLVVGAVLMIRTFLTLRPVEPGFNPSNTLTATVRLHGKAAGAPTAFFGPFLDRVRTLPGVRSVAGSTYVPMSGLTSRAAVTLGETTVSALSGAVTANYFADLEIPIRLGRSFTERDDASAASVAIVNEAFVRGNVASGNPVGMTIAVQIGGRRAVREIVGVVGDTRFVGSDLRARPEIYVPFAQHPGPLLNLFIRGEPSRDARLPSAVRAAAAVVDPTQVVDRFSPYREMVDSRVATPRFGAWVLGLFAAMASALAAVGLAAAIAWVVTERRREIGVRMALGARPQQVTALVVRQGLTMALIGVLLGLAGAFGSTRLLSGWLYGVSPLDARTFALSAVAMLAIAALASYLPARRAAQVDPLVSLRMD
jgi:putative ABC transport system permease protein